jgi:hypothetical protein
MKIFLILYTIGILLSFSVFYIITAKETKKYNDLFVKWYTPASVPIFKIILMSIIFPIALFIVILDILFVQNRK